ncbi:hypothetical protein GH5_04108 [Leishmania sp. Ghana 2012 LV757]|uniref:hypothetical protein n=1 Tax=Leishmania sp. Ghana 2012 LV757 TaxID=2803181 RepID=UPI001B52F547|nr:hypothetical protein GH5_04108 [Leishmania sp. Ghana 2012 LV757]
MHIHTHTDVNQIHTKKRGFRSRPSLAFRQTWAISTSGAPVRRSAWVRAPAAASSAPTRRL